MLFENVSYNDSHVRRRICTEVGPPIGFLRSLRSGGTGFGGIFIELAPLIAGTTFYGVEDRIFSVLEFRNKGLVIRSKVRTETYALAIPFTEITNIRIVQINEHECRLLIETEQDGLSLRLHERKKKNLRNRLAIIPCIQGTLVCE
jgi:hypothetical protein